MIAAGVVVLADHGSLSVSPAFFGPVFAMLVALAVITWRERRRRKARGEEPDRFWLHRRVPLPAFASTWQRQLARRQYARQRLEEHA